MARHGVPRRATTQSASRKHEHRERAGAPGVAAWGSAAASVALARIARELVAHSRIRVGANIASPRVVHIAIQPVDRAALAVDVAVSRIVLAIGARAKRVSGLRERRGCDRSGEHGRGKEQGLHGDEPFLLEPPSLPALSSVNTGLLLQRTIF